MLKLNIKTSIPVPNNIMWGKNQNWNSFNETNTILILNIIWKTYVSIVCIISSLPYSFYLYYQL